MASRKEEMAQQIVNRVLDGVVWDHEHELGYLHTYDPRHCRDERVGRELAGDVDVYLLALDPFSLKQMVTNWRETQNAKVS